MTSPETLRRLEAIIERSAETAGPAIARNFIGGGWRMSAEEFVAFWSEPRMAAIATTSAAGRVHIAPLDFALVDGAFEISTFADSQRLRDHRANPRCAITSWDGPYRAVIVYGDAHVPPAAEPASGLLTVTVTPTRIYGIRPPAGHPTHDA